MWHACCSLQIKFPGLVGGQPRVAGNQSRFSLVLDCGIKTLALAVAPCPEEGPRHLSLPSENDILLVSYSYYQEK